MALGIKSAACKDGVAVQLPTGEQSCVKPKPVKLEYCDLRVNPLFLKSLEKQFKDLEAGKKPATQKR